MKLNLGAGYIRKPGYKNVDIRWQTKPDFLIDLEKPHCLKRFKKNSIDEIFTSSFLEHVKNYEGLMSEIYRVCKPNARVIINVPHVGNQSSFCDPTHVRYFTENSMAYLDKATIGSDQQPITVPYDFKIEAVDFQVFDEYKGMSVKKVFENSRKYWNVIKKITFVLRVNK